MPFQPGKKSGSRKRIDSRLANLPVHGRGRAANADGSDALSFDRDRKPALDADEPAGSHAERLSEHLMIGDLCAFAILFAGRRRGEGGAARLRKSQQRIMGAAIGHSFESEKVAASVDHRDTDDLLQLLRFLNRRVDNNIRALLGQFERRYYFHRFLRIFLCTMVPQGTRLSAVMLSGAKHLNFVSHKVVLTRSTT